MARQIFARPLCAYCSHKQMIAGNQSSLRQVIVFEIAVICVVKRDYSSLIWTTCGYFIFIHLSGLNEKVIY